ncbi:phosphoenolpyruvate--protein phosphotransferase [Propylenella binzhouense]|uniref:phosphoenolpyruvate--protein phosphotransferase n=1 Tax=Propylenella binzhouense TaxID=2555902 RepID=A0A964T8X5_9HYPH|nr:phosphoenolpyruvate--protein phosphotransferase [Propylenella binzhouense]MYZ49527.1 phosphoenolpyruvate--protein phosphotransferase [Propylenella binzhouense]
MAEPIGAQERLDKIVTIIAANMVAEVCSVYVLRSDGVLELFATEGLKATSVHRATLTVGRGLVGLIAAEARPLNLPDAQTHPAFAYLPETGEEIYHSFLGVPILRAGRTLGVLVVQNRSFRTYMEEEVEALQTTAMVLAEMFAAGEIEDLAAPGADLDLNRAIHFTGAAFCDGIALGHVVLHEPRIVVTQLIAEDAEHELKRLDAAMASLRLSVDDLLARSAAVGTGEHREILEAYRMFAQDRGWTRRLQEAIEAGLTAEAAVEKVQNDTRARMLRQTDPFLRDRLHDFDDLANRLLRELMGRPHGPFAGDLPEDAVIVARNMGAAELLDYDRRRVRGLVLEEAGPTGHVSIVARALGIATVGQVQDLVALAESGDAIIVDGETGEVHLRPPADIETAYADKVRFRARKQEQYRLLRDEPAITRDGVAVGLHINAGLLMDLPHLDESGASGIGLFRTELQFMISTAFPRQSEQQAFYTQVMQAAGDKPVIFRSLDVGGDKVLPYLRSQAEENPAMGWRAIRLGLDRPALLRTQVRSMLKAAAGRELRLMFPMVTEVGEFRRAKAIVEREQAHLSRHGHDGSDDVVLGVMVEVPALLFQLDELFAAVDFVSVGTNDLLQFLMASDRGNTRLAGRYDPLSPAFLRALMAVVEKSTAAGKPVSLCGEMAGRPIEAMALLAIGYRSLSMASSSIGPIKAMVRALDLAPLRKRLLDLLDAGAAAPDIRGELRAWAAAHGIPV